ncbi:MAG TPA: PH domain-containing protein [Acidimicrobiales bacterium]|nr:PH domain-containing protein [Acidimicrobiales bacterium]
MPISTRLLDDDEELLVDLRPHWVFMLGPAVLTAVAVAVAITVAVRFPNAPVAVAWVLAAMVAVPAVWLAARVVRWYGISLVVTTNRLVYRRGILGRDLVQVRLQRITEVHYTQTLPDRIIGSGRLVVELAGESPMAVDDVRRPRSLQRVISRQLDELAYDRPPAGMAPPAGMVPPGGMVPPAAGVIPPATDVPARPVVVPEPFTLADTPPHGTPVVPPGVATTLPSAPAVPSLYGPSPTPPPAAQPPAAPSVPDQLIQLDDLRRRGIISDAEFEAKKTELLSRL